MPGKLMVALYHGRRSLGSNSVVHHIPRRMKDGTKAWVKYLSRGSTKYLRKHTKCITKIKYCLYGPTSVSSCL